MADTATLFIQTSAIEDVDAMAAAIADGLETEYVQLEARPFKAQWTIASLQAMVVQFGREDVAIVRRLRIPAGRWAFVVPLAVPDSARWNGCRVDGDEVIICPPLAECYAFDPRATTFAIVSVPEKSAIASAARDLLDATGSTRTVLPRAHDARELHHWLNAVLTKAATDGWCAAGVERRIDGALDRCLRSAVPAERHVEASTGRSQIVRRAEAFFRRHLGEPVSIAQLSSIAGVSERSLRNACHEVCGTSPKRYLTRRRMEAVRQALENARPGESTVTRIATDYGFFELGRFAATYSLLFGERPSDTLRGDVST